MLFFYLQISSEFSSKTLLRNPTMAFDSLYFVTLKILGINVFIEVLQLRCYNKLHAVKVYGKSVFWAGVVVEKAMGSVPGKQRPNSFVETVQVQSAPMEDSPTKHGKHTIRVRRGIYSPTE